MYPLAQKHQSGAFLGTSSDTDSLRARLLALPRLHKRILQVTADTVLIWFSLWLAFYLRLDDLAAADPLNSHAWLFLLAPLLSVPLLARMGLYRAVLRHMGLPAVGAVIKGVILSAALLALAVWLHGPADTPIPRSVIFIHAVLSLILIGGLRLTMRQYFQTAGVHVRRRSAANAHNATRVAIYGAGTAGSQLLAALQGDRNRRVVAFLDDNPDLHGRTVGGLPVHDPEDINRLIETLDIEEVLLAMPTTARSRRRAIIDRLAVLPVAIRTVPGIRDLASGKVRVNEIREIDLGDLLGRDPVQPDQELLERCIRGQTVMVTGAGGSIGAELCRQILACAPHTLVLFEQCEYNLYNIQSDLEERVRNDGLSVRIVPILNSVRDEHRLFDVMSAWNVDTVYHAAAYKHVPMVECNVAEGILNNVFGTLHCAQAALRAGVPNFVLISTDKAVRPTNTMGCTKRLAELILQALAFEERPVPYGVSDADSLPARTRFTMVRFGNVLGSSGSVVPRFRRQIQAGGPVTVTHPEITRYFMTIPEAALLVIQAGSMGAGGDVFVLDMGEPVRISALAEKMILLSGLSVCSPANPDGDIAIEYVGLRPGEKLYEELLIGANVSQTAHPRIMRASERRLAWADLKTVLADLECAIADDNYPRIRSIFLEVVDGYRPECEVVDWIHLHHATGYAGEPH
ncbi:polysaccharide biosynthesis protein [bacterium SGD-2]|nr:polysaccharide biosynthesis protein [bacterium SGD-2]